MEKAKTFEDLLVWKKAHAFVILVYKQTQSFPNAEIYGLTSQFRRAAVSIAANIAEGFAKKSRADKSRFFNIAKGSLEECRYYTILIRDLNYCEIAEIQQILQEVSKLLNAYSRKIIEGI
jgi:four helix bundle protein